MSTTGSARNRVFEHLVFDLANGGLKTNIPTNGNQEFASDVFLNSQLIQIKTNYKRVSSLKLSLVVMDILLADDHFPAFTWRKNAYFFYLDLLFRSVRTANGRFDKDLLNRKGIKSFIGCPKPNVDFIRFIPNTVKFIAPNICTTTADYIYGNPLLHPRSLNVSLPFYGSQGYVGRECQHPIWNVCRGNQFGPWI